MVFCSYQWRARSIAACLLALIIPLCPLRVAKSEPDAAVAAPALPQTVEGEQSIERSLLKEGVNPFPERENPQQKPAVSQALLRQKFEEAKRDAATLVELAQSLKADLDGANENVVSLAVVKKAEKIEKLAKKIKKWSTAQ